MDAYLATFFSHFGALRFGRQLRALGVDHALMPVPRRVSSSCGTCVRFTAEALPPDLDTGDVERLFQESDGRYTELFSNL